MPYAKWTRLLHRWGSVVIAAPLLLVILSGLLLLLKKEIHWIQPATQQATPFELELGLDEVLELCRSVPEANITDWSDVDRIDYRPALGLYKVHAHKRWEIQIDAGSGEILQTAERRSDWIESLHDGSFFHENAKLLVFLPSALVLLLLWFTGLYLFALPYLARRRRQSGRLT